MFVLRASRRGCTSSALRGCILTRAWRPALSQSRSRGDGVRRDTVNVHSDKEHAAGHYEGDFGFNPLLATCGREVLAGILRPGNAGASNADDHIAVLDLALEQLPKAALDGEILAGSKNANRNEGVCLLRVNTVGVRRQALGGADDCCALGGVGRVVGADRAVVAEGQAAFALSGS